MNNYKAHQNLIKKFKIDIQKEIKGIRLFDRHVGMFFTQRGTPIMINKKGMADCYGLVPTEYGLIHVEFEFKTGKAKQSKDQKIWENYILSMSGIYLLIREDYDNSIDELKKAMNV